MANDSNEGIEMAAHLGETTISPAGEEITEKLSFENLSAMKAVEVQDVIKSLSADELIDRAIVHMANSEKPINVEGSKAASLRAMSYIALATYRRDEERQVGAELIDPTEAVFG